jgi:bis(5'-nucleosidyl)-tetraphosphatase
MKNKRYCFGIIPIKHNGLDWEVLLVKHNKGHWAFPKGHPLKDETPEQIACREVYEETGLSVDKFFQVCPLIEEYTFFEADKKIEKVVTYFIAEVRGEVTLLKKELCDSQWLSFDAAAELISFDQSRQVCLKAREILSIL